MSPKPFSEMTEEERVEWAKNHKQIPRTKVSFNTIVTSSKAKAKARMYGREHRKADYYDPEKRKKQWGDDYNARIRYLYQHNEEFRELKKYRVRYRLFRKRKYEYHAWIHTYKQKYKDKMQTHASIFRLENSENYVYGFTIKDLIPYSPVKKGLIDSLISNHILPAPKYSGYKYVKDKWSKTTEQFYLVSEIEAYLNIFARYKKKFELVHTEQQRLFLKKEFWTKMIQAREEFDNG